MHAAIRRFVPLAGLVAALAGPAAAACPGECSVPGGGDAATDCVVEFDGVAPVVAGGSNVRCTDGDPTCDTDGVANGSCRYRLAVCVNNPDPRLPACTPGDLASFTLRGRRLLTPELLAALEPLEDAVAAHALPTSDRFCTAPVTVRVPLAVDGRRFAKGTALVKTLARTRAGASDADSLRLRCLPSPALPKPRSTYARARTITHPAELIEGPLARGRLGDVLLANDRIQVVIQQPGRAMFGIGTYGGTIIDADLQRATGDERDSFEELLPAINIENTANYTAVQVLNDGTDGAPAVVRATGPDDLLDFINASSVVEMAGFTFPASADDRDLPVEIQTDYTLAPGARHVQIDTTVTNTGAAPLDLFLGEYLNGSGQIELFQPGLGFGEPLVTLTCPEGGYQSCPRGTCDLCGFVAYAGEDLAAGVSYGFFPALNGSSTFSVSGVTAVLFGNQVLAVLIGAGEPNFHLAPAGTPGAATTVTSYFAVGDGSVAAIADVRNSVFRIATGVFQGRVTSGGAALADADVAVLGPPVPGGPARNVVDHFRTDSGGRYRGTLPPGTYTVRVNKDGRLFGTPDPVTVTIPPGGNVVQNFALPAAGGLRVTVADEQGRPVPAKVNVVGFDPSPDPLNTQSIAGVINNVTGVFGEQREDGLPFGIAAVAFADRTGDTGVVDLEPGTYHVYVSRGSRYSLFVEKDVEIAAGIVRPVTARLARVVDPPGFITADFHVHAIDSPDSEVTRTERVATQLAEGIDFFTPSEHDIRVDFAPTIVAMGVGALIATAPSAEITTFDYGHFNSWPVTVDAAAVNGGTVDWGRAGIAPGADFPALGSFGLTPAEIFAAAHADPRPNLIQINHIDSFFNVTGLDIDTAEGGTGPPQSHVVPGTRRLDPAVPNYFDTGFDALEVWNGSVAIFLGENIGDWFNLLNQGIRRTAVADSDTHERRTNGGSVRTYVASAVTDPGMLAARADDLAAAIVAGRAAGTNGPFVTIAAHAASTGEDASLAAGAATTLATTDGAVDVTVTVASPLWAEFDRVELYVNNAPQPWDHDGRPATRPRYRAIADVVRTAGADFTVTSVEDFPLAGAGHLEATVTVPLSGLTADVWVVALVRGTAGVSRPLFPVLPFGLRREGNETLDGLGDGNLGEGGETALAFTNALYVDVDHDGTWTAPGVRLTPP